MTMLPIELTATTTFGLEAIVKRELQNLGYRVDEVSDGKVTITARKEDIPRTNLWIRSADRILLNMGSFPVRTFDELFEGTRALPWDEWISRDGSFPVSGKSSKSVLSSVPACQGIVKKAIVEKMKANYHVERFPESGPSFPVQVSLLNDIANLTIDTSGIALHKRGYRNKAVEAPLKETLAAAMVQLSFWNADRLLVDPFCGSGTILIEAALIGHNIPPGLHRTFASERWPAVPGCFWQSVREEAEGLINRSSKLVIHGFDIDQRAVGISRENARKAGVMDAVHFSVRPLEKTDLAQRYGVVITNPPYGERTGKRETVQHLCREIGRIFRSDPTWSVYVLSPENDFERLYGKKADRKRKLFNGTIQVNYFQFYGERPPRGH